MNQREMTKDLFSWRNVKQEILTNLPAWFFLIQAASVHNIFMANVPQAWFQQVGVERSWFALLILPISIWFYAFYRVRLRDSRLDFDKKLIHRLVIFIAFVIPFVNWALYAVFPGLRFELSARVFHVIFEYSNLAWAAIFVAWIFYYRGFARLVTFFGVAFLYGLALENTGIYLQFFFEPGYDFYLLRLPAPMATMLGWCIVISCCVWVVDFFRQSSPRLKKSAALTALATTVLAISADVQLDPLASFPDMWWRWNELLPSFWYGVPFCNYAAWFGAFFAFSFVYYRIFDREDMTIWQKNARLLLYVPSIAIFAGLTWLGIMIVWETIVPQSTGCYPTVQILWNTMASLWPY
ncbi:MAG: carotenoid biosynthesis protein [Candidatus Lernaella stagnicola]|nr:carotenoid biosynthesis protein [Candidatus Lernaella stagnicola]